MIVYNQIGLADIFYLAHTMSLIKKKVNLTFRLCDFVSSLEKLDWAYLVSISKGQLFLKFEWQLLPLGGACIFS